MLPFYRSTSSVVAMAKQLLHLAKLICSLVAITINLPISAAGEWIVETHSLVIRAPATIAGVQDAAIGDVSCHLT